MQEGAHSKVQGPVSWDASKKAWVPAKGKATASAQAAARVPDVATPVSREEEGYHTSKLPTLRSEDELAAYQRDLAAKAKTSRYLIRTLIRPLVWSSLRFNGFSPYEGLYELTSAGSTNKDCRLAQQSEYWGAGC